MAPRLSGQNCKFFKFLLSFSFHKRLRYKRNNTKYRSLTWKPRSHVRILIYRTWPIWLTDASTHLKSQLGINRTYNSKSTSEYIDLMQKNTEQKAPTKYLITDTGWLSSIPLTTIHRSCLYQCTTMCTISRYSGVLL